MAIRMRRTDVKRVRDKLQKEQGNICPLCNTEIATDMAVLDHSHQHGYVREVLCRNCNAMEGKVFNLATRAKRGGTALEWLTRLVQYLSKHSSPQTGFIHHTHKTPEEKKMAQKIRRLKNKKAKPPKLVKKPSKPKAGA